MTGITFIYLLSLSLHFPSYINIASLHDHIILGVARKRRINMVVLVVHVMMYILVRHCRGESVIISMSFRG